MTHHEHLCRTTGCLPVQASQSVGQSLASTVADWNDHRQEYHTRKMQACGLRMLPEDERRSVA